MSISHHSSSTEDVKRVDDASNSNTNSNPNHSHVIAETTQPDNEFKEGGYGWVVVIAVALLNSHTWGVNGTFSVFLAYYLRADLFGDASPIGYAIIGGLSISVGKSSSLPSNWIEQLTRDGQSLSTLLGIPMKDPANSSIAFLISPLATMLVGWKKGGTRKTIFLGVILETVAFIGSSFTKELWQLVLSQGVCFGLGMGLIFVASVPVPAQWFTKHRSLANACAAGGSGMGGLIYVLATSSMIRNFGLAWTFRSLGIICFVVNTISCCLIRDRNREVGSIFIAFNWGLFKRPSFLLLQAWLFFSMIAYVAFMFSLVDYAQAVGMTASQASIVSALANLSQGLGRPVIGIYSDRLGRINVAMACTAIAGVLCLFFWIFGTQTFAGCVIFALMTGGVAGVMWAAVSPVTAEVVGLPLIPSALSMSWLVLIIPSTFAEVIVVGLRRPGRDGYLHAQLLIGLLYIVACVCSLFLRAWKINDLAKAKVEGEQRELGVREDGVVPSVALEVDAEKQSITRRRLRNVQGIWALQRV